MLTVKAFSPARTRGNPFQYPEDGDSLGGSSADTPENLDGCWKILRRDVQRRPPWYGSRPNRPGRYSIAMAACLDLEHRSTPQSIQPKWALALEHCRVGLHHSLLRHLVESPAHSSATQKRAGATCLSLPIYFTESDHILSPFTQFLLTPQSDRLILRTQKGILIHPLDHVGPTAQLNHHFVQEPFISPKGDRIAYLTRTNSTFSHSRPRSARFSAISMAMKHPTMVVGCGAPTES